MKYLIIIPAKLTVGKRPAIVPAIYYLTEAFNIEQAKRRASSIKDAPKAMTVQPLDDFVGTISTV